MQQDRTFQTPTSLFNIHDHVTFSHCSTRSTKHSKLLYMNSFSNISKHFYFCRFPSIWNVLPYNDLNLLLTMIPVPNAL